MTSRHPHPPWCEPGMCTATAPTWPAHRSRTVQLADVRLYVELSLHGAPLAVVVIPARPPRIVVPWSLLETLVGVEPQLRAMLGIPAIRRAVP